MTLSVVRVSLLSTFLSLQALGDWAEPTIIKQTRVLSSVGELSQWTCTIAGPSVVIVDDIRKKIIKRRTLTWDSEFTPAKDEVLQDIAQMLSQNEKAHFKVKKDAKRGEQIWVADKAKSMLVGQMAIQPEYQNWNSPYLDEATSNFVWAQCQTDDSFAQEVKNVKKLLKGGIEVWPPSEEEESEE